MTKVVTANSAIAGSDCRVRSSERRSLARIAAKAAREGVTSTTARLADPQPQHLVGFGHVAVGVVGDDDAGAPGAGADQPARQLATLGVEVGVGLVEQQQLRLVQDAAADRQPLAHPGRELGDPLVGAALHPDGAEQLLDPRLGLGAPAIPCRRAVEAQVLAAAEVAVEQRLVAEVADPAAQLPGLVRQRAAEHRDLAAAGAQQRREDPQQRRLAGAVGPEHDQRVAGQPARGRRRRAPAGRRSRAAARRVRSRPA